MLTLVLHFWSAVDRSEGLPPADERGADCQGEEKVDFEGERVY